jgi:hypothetical protein
MKTTKEAKQKAYENLKEIRGQRIGVVIKSVSRSGMSRRFEFYAEGYKRIGSDIATLLEYPYDYDKGLRADGCGMDMIFSVLSNLNYRMATLDTGKTIQELLTTKECGERIYDNYFVDADHYTTL